MGGDDDVPSGGRRDYDTPAPLMEALEQRLLRALEKGLGDTRHTMREELASIAAKVETILLQGRDVTASLANLHTDMAELKPEVKDLTRRVEVLENQERADQAVASALERNRKQQVENKRQIRTWGIAICAIVVGAMTPITVAVVSHL